LGYHDEIKILLKNNGTQPYTVMKGDRIAQFVLEKVYTAKWETVDNLEEHINESRANEKGEQGFGSTGR
jgi:dUTP pyrophosphatase